MTNKIARAFIDHMIENLS